MLKLLMIDYSHRLQFKGYRVRYSLGIFNWCKGIGNSHPFARRVQGLAAHKPIIIRMKFDFFLKLRRKY